ncbi:MAG: CotH kinase family protein [Bacilli bacterium]
MFNFKILKENKKFFLGSLIIIVIAILATVIFNSKDFTLEDKELVDNGNNNIYKLVINEIMTSNHGAYSDTFGNQYDWLELYNGSNHDINLKNYGLSDKDNKIKWVFPNVTIKANGYLIINLSGTKDEGLYADFKLSSSGFEAIALKNANGKTIDAVNTVKMHKNEVMVRDLNGNWYMSKQPTPGYINTKEGLKKYQTSLMGTGDIKINEILPKNSGNYFDNYGDFTGFIEVINTGNKTINLKSYTLSNSIYVPFKWQFPDMEIKPNQVIAIYTNSKDNVITTDFNFDNEKGTAFLANNGKIIDQVTYEDLPNGFALKKEEDLFVKTNIITPGFENNNKGINDFNNKVLKNKNDLIINEVMNNNSNYLGHNGNTFYDWIELKNNSNHDINLRDYSLSTNTDIKDMYKLPDVVLKPNELYVLMASGDVNLSGTYKHTNFKLSTFESLYLYKDKIVDSIFIASVPLNYSMGRNSDNGYYYFNNPSPLKENGQGLVEVSMKPIFNKDSGIYNNIDNLTLVLKATGNIYYTLDGSLPTTSSFSYKEPIILDKTTVIRAVSYEENKVISDIITNSYIINEKHTLPVLSVSGNVASLNGNEEEVAYAEFYEDGKSFSIPCGVQLFGGSTRFLPKKSFALKFKKRYGPNTLNYKVFDNRDFTSFKTLVLRSGSQDYNLSAMRDVVMTSLMEDSKAETQAYKSVVLYINGQYWGLYDIREKVEKEFIANHYNVTAEKVNIARIDGDITCGSNKDYLDLMDYIASHDLKIQANYDYVKTKINMESYMDFWAAETYTANNDILNQRFFSHPDIDNGRWQYIFYDLDFGMYNVNHNYYNFTVQPEGMSDFKISTFLMRNLVRNEEFKKEYVKKISYHLKNNWSKDNVLKKIDEVYKQLKPEMIRNCDRWGFTMDSWEIEVNKLRDYAKNRSQYMIRDAKYFFNLNNEEMKEYFGDVV